MGRVPGICSMATGQYNPECTDDNDDDDGNGNLMQGCPGRWAETG